MRGPGASAKTQYAVQAVIHLARREPGHVAPVSEIAAAAGIPAKFLEEVLSSLRTAGIVQSRRGKDGGYTLARDPAALTVWEIVWSVEGPVEGPARAVESTAARAAAQAFESALAAAAARLSAVTVAELVETTGQMEAEESEEAEAYMYHL
jgi:Rrf2 family protein